MTDIYPPADPALRKTLDEFIATVRPKSGWYTAQNVNLKTGEKKTIFCFNSPHDNKTWNVWQAAIQSVQPVIN